MALDRSINSSEPRLYHPLNEGYSNTPPSLLERIKEVIHRKCLAWKSGCSRDVVCVHCHHWEKASIGKINLQCSSRPSPGRPSSLCCSIIHPHIHLSKKISLPLIKISSKSDKMLHAWNASTGEDETGRTWVSGFRGLYKEFKTHLWYLDHVSINKQNQWYERYF